MYHLKDTLFYSWSRFPDGIMDCDIDDGAIGYVHADRLMRLREMVTRRPLVLEERAVAWGHAVAEEDLHHSTLIKLKARTRKRSQRDRDEDEESQKMWRKITSGEKTRGRQEGREEQIEELQAAMRAVQERLENDLPLSADGNGQGVNAGKATIVVPRAGLPRLDKATLLASSPLGGVRVGRSTSSKLNYILSEVSGLTCRPCGPA